MEIKESIERFGKVLNQELVKRSALGYYVLLSPGPGVSGKGAPGATSAVTLALCVELLGTARVKAVTCYIEGITNPEWAEKAGEYAKSLEVDWELLDITQETKSWSDLLEKREIKKHQGSTATRIRSLVVQDIADENNYLTVSGYTVIQRSFYKVNDIDDKGQAAPLADLNRTQAIEIGSMLGVPDEVLYQRPSNGSLKDGTRMMNHIFSHYNMWDFSLCTLLDTFYQNLSQGRKAVYGINGLNPAIIEAAEKAEREYKDLEGQLNLIRI